MRTCLLRRICITLLLPLVIGVPAVAQTTIEPGDSEEIEAFIPTYGVGDQILSINLGLFIPLFFAGSPQGLQNTSLTAGGTGNLMWGSYLSNNFAVGGELGGMFAFTPNNRTLFMIPLALRATYFIRSYPFEFPLSMAVGMNFSRLDDNFKTDPIVIPGVGLYWNYNAEWAFGFDIRYWWVPQFYPGPDPPAEDSRFGNFLAVTLAAIYHF